MTQQRLVIFSFVVGAILFGWAVQAASNSGIEYYGAAGYRVFGGLVDLSVLLGVLGGAGGFLFAVRNRQWVRFVGEVVSELLKVTWPSRDETVSATSTVIFTTFFVAGVIAVFDLVWKNIAVVFLFSAA